MGSSWFHPFIIYIIYITEFVSFMTICLRINDSGLFAWISLTALSRTYLIVYIVCDFNDLTG